MDASTGSSTHSTTQIRALEERAFNAWPALETSICNGWLFRVAQGYTKRANSVNALTPCGSFEETLAEAERYFTNHDLPLIFRISPLAGTEVDEKLQARGFTRFDETLVMTAPIGAFAVDEHVLIRTTPDEWWSAGFTTASGTAAHHQRTHDQILMRIARPMGCAMVVEKAQPIAFGMGVMERGMIGLFDIVTVANHRRRGAGKKIVGSLLAWGAAHGAQGAYLQVMANNAAAIALYEKFGFKEAYRYHYWIRE